MMKKMIVFVIGKKTFPRIQQKKKNTLETIKEELISFLKYIDDEDKHQLEEMVGHIKNAEKAAGEVQRYEEILKTRMLKSSISWGNKVNCSSNLRIRIGILR